MLAQRALRRRTPPRLRRRPRTIAVADARITTVAHEMRAPLTAIVGALGLVEPADLTAEAAGLINVADRNAQRLTRLVDDLLAEEAGSVIDGLPVRLRALDLRHIVAQLATDSGLALAAKRLTLTAPPARRPMIVLGDGDRLLQALTNIMVNAIRVAPAGSRIDLTLTATGGDALVHIADRGPGIPLGLRPHLFLRGTRGHADGHGLGLSIARGIVARHRGQITFADRAGGGTRFTVAVPLA